jgi:hypothetical protein
MRIRYDADCSWVTIAWDLRLALGNRAPPRVDAAGRNETSASQDTHSASPGSARVTGQRTRYRAAHASQRSERMLAASKDLSLRRQRAQAGRDHPAGLSRIDDRVDEPTLGGRPRREVALLVVLFRSAPLLL